MLVDKRFKLCLCFFGLVLRRCRINDGGIQNVSDVVYYCDLTAGSVCGVKAHNDLAAYGRKHKKVFEVFAENADSLLLCIFGYRVAHFGLNRGRDKAFVSIVGRFTHKIGARAFTRGEHLTAEVIEDLFLVDLDLYRKDALLFASVDRQNTVRRHFGKRLVIIVIKSVNAVLLGFRLRNEVARAIGKFAYPLAEFGIIRNTLGNNILCAAERIGCGVYLLFGVKIVFSLGNYVNVLFLLKHKLGKGRKTCLRRNARTGAALGTVGAVNILKLGKRLRVFDSVDKLLGELTLLVDKALNVCASCIERAVEFKLFAKLTQFFIVKRAGRLFTVTRDKGDRIALIDKRNRRLDLLYSYF